MKQLNLNGLELLKTRLQNRGGASQQARMIKDKRRTLDRTVLYSYQGAEVRRPGETETARALINPNQLNQDYDNKVLSIGYEYGYQPGDIFEWVNTGTKWLIYLQDLTELAYFRGDIRKCSYEISWEDENGQVQTTYAAVRGPQEKALKSLQKKNLSIDLPNYTLNLLLPNNEKTSKEFTRYSKFYLKNDPNKTCWRIEATDSISNPSILEIYATEYYTNDFEDDLENGVVGGLVVKTPEEDISSDIMGDTFIRPNKTYHYEYIGQEISEWNFDKNLPIEAEISDSKISIKWLKNYSGQFVIRYGTVEKTIVVESLF